MKEETANRIVAILKEEAPDTDVLLVTHNKKDGISSVISGSPISIARAVFTITCDSQNPVHANNVYNIIKNVACNIVSNPSAMAKDLLANIMKHGKAKQQI